MMNSPPPLLATVFFASLVLFLVFFVTKFLEFRRRTAKALDETPSLNELRERRLRRLPVQSASAAPEQRVAPGVRVSAPPEPVAAVSPVSRHDEVQLLVSRHDYVQLPAAPQEASQLPAAPQEAPQLPAAPQ